MPNGESKNWVRFIITISKFYALYGKYPTQIFLQKFFIEELEEKLSEEDLLKLKSKIELIADDNKPFLAKGSEGNMLQYGSEGYSLEINQTKTKKWLDIQEPDYYD